MEEDDNREVLKPSFEHLKELYSLEQGKLHKMAHKLNERVLHPTSIEKTSVKLADAAFHESTINALNYYARNGYEHFRDTASFAKIVRDWFNKVNVKSTNYGTHSRDDERNPIRKESMEDDLSSIRSVCSWLEKWLTNSGRSGGLSLRTFEAAIRTNKAIIVLAEYLLEHKTYLNYVLLGNIQSDYLDQRFGWYRQLCCGNYDNSVTQFLQAEKTVRLRSLVKMGFDMEQIKSIFECTQEESSVREQEDIRRFVSD